MIILGIDPGINGGLAILENGVVIHTLPMPKMEDQNGTNIVDSNVLCNLFEEYNFDKVVIEDIHSIYGTSAKSTFNFGRNTGMVESLILAFGYELIKVKPKSWQVHAWRDLPKLKKKDGGNDTKAMSLTALYKYFPSIDKNLLLRTKKCRSPHDGIVDAILIAKFN